MKNMSKMESTVPKIVVNYKQITDKVFVGQCPDNLQFLVQTNSKSEIKTEIKEMIEDYVEVFPKTKKEILPEGDNFRIVLKEK